MSKNATMWIDADRVLMNMPEGSPGFLIEISPQGRTEVYELRDEPGRTNRSHEARLDGWLGTTNNVGCSAEGIWKPIKTSLNKRRVLIEEVTDRHEIELFLEAVGWPELLEELDE